jgi:GNAT superfamily N-acetyltransferase
MAEHMGYTTRTYQEKDKASILELNAMQGGVPELADSAYFDWLYSENPEGEPILSVAAETDTDRVVGFLWYIPVRWRCLGHSELVYMGANALVHPDHRRKGIFGALQAMAVPECGRRGAKFIYGFGRPISLRGVRHLGFGEATMPLLIRPLDAKRLAEARGFGPLLQWAARMGWGLASATVFRPRSVNGGLVVRQEIGFDAACDRFWQSLSDKYPIALERSHAFLQWRFGTVPCREYQILTSRDGSEVRGYAVIRCAEIQGVQCGLIMDLLVEPTTQGREAGALLLDGAAQRFRDEGMWMAACLMLEHTEEYRLLDRAGYIRFPYWLAPQSYVLSVRGASAGDLPGPLRDHIGKWFVTLASHDAC